MKACVLIALALQFFVSAAELPATLLAERGKEVFSEAFDKQPDKTVWRPAKGKWEIVDGAMKAAELKEDNHGAVARHVMAFKDAVFQFEFKLDGCRTISFSVNDAKEHVCRVVINKAGFLTQKDDHDHDGPDKAVQFDRKTIKLDDGQWHTAVVEIVGETILASIDGKEASFGSHELIGTPKANFGLTVGGESAWFKNVKAWEATPNKDWEKNKEKLGKK